MFTDKIKQPTLVVFKKTAENNLNKMMRKAVLSNIEFRPHFKTHQSDLTGNLFKNHGVKKITVSSVTMAEYFAKSGWKDITIAFPVNIREWEKIDALAGKIKLNLLVESVFTTTFLAGKLNNKVNIFIKIDTGYHRTGLQINDPEINTIVERIKKTENLNFSGFLTHAGHNYSAIEKAEILSNMNIAKKQLSLLKKRFPGSIISYGDTPSCSIAGNCDGFDEIRPGNFIYYDIMQYHLGSCNLEDIAAVVACPVVAVYPEREEMVIYGGAVHLSKETIEGDNGFKLFGYVVNFSGNGRTKPLTASYVSALSQEHGTVKMKKEMLKQYKSGDLIGILPVHSCLAANLLKENIILA